jgi:hypothetical protein
MPPPLTVPDLSGLPPTHTQAVFAYVDTAGNAHVTYAVRTSTGFKFAASFEKKRDEGLVASVKCQHSW